MKSHEIASLLPGIFRLSVRDGNPMKALLTVMESLHEPSERVLADIDSYFDPRRAPDAFVPYLAHWVDLDRFLQTNGSKRVWTLRSSISLPQLREWVAAAAQLSKWRGTAKGLKMVLEVATGVVGFRILEGVDLDGKPRAFHLRVIAPAESESQSALIARIIELEKPAYVTCSGVEFTSAQVTS
jgi:phage tail-like protein